MLTVISLLSAFSSLVLGQLPPKPEGVTTIKSKFHENVTISFKEPGICETTPGVKSYSGYVHLPPHFLEDGTGLAQDYPINTFFWFFEARKDPENAPLSIWLNGGPGGTSLMGLLEENGPCFVAEDGKSTYLNPWSWNNEVNMLFLDQPTQVGFSYDIPTNCTTRLIRYVDDWGFERIPTDFSDGIPKANFSSPHALWHFAQTWFFEFPHYKPKDNSISLWAESYGGHYGPAMFQFFQQQNEKIKDGSSTEEGAHIINLDTLGIVNGLVDMVLQGEAYIEFPYSNTYGIQLFNQSTYDRLMDSWNRPGGCKEKMSECQNALKDQGTILLSDTGKNLTEICEGIDEACGDIALRTYFGLKDARGWYDIGHPMNDPFPVPTLHGYLTEESVLSALGVPVNFTDHSAVVSLMFQSTYDIIIGGFTDAIAYLLDSGVKVHMMYGDRDYACNWFGGEKASLAVPYSRAADFAKAGYAPLITPDGLSGWTRQFGNFSFTRVYQAGHEVPSYQPVAAYEIFMRAARNVDISTGTFPVTDEYSTYGPPDTRHIKNTPPEKPKPRCYILKPITCTAEIWQKVVDGKAIIKNWFVVDVDDEEDDSLGGGGGALPPTRSGEEQAVIDEL